MSSIINIIVTGLKLCWCPVNTYKIEKNKDIHGTLPAYKGDQEIRGHKYRGVLQLKLQIILYLLNQLICNLCINFRFNVE